jgi:alpha/beta hydrolase fold
MSKTNSLLHSSLYMIITVLLVVSVSISIIGIGQVTPQISSAQQQPQTNFTSAEQQSLTEGNSFEIDNMTFSHHTASVNGIQMHYVIGGEGDPVVLLHGWPQTWYEWRHIMPVLATNYTVIVPDLRGLGDSSIPTTGYDGILLQKISTNCYLS